MALTQQVDGEQIDAADFNQIIDLLQGSGTETFILRTASGQDFVIVLPEAGGIQDFVITDSAADEVFRVDSNGVVTLTASDIVMNTSAGLLKHEAGGMEFDVSAITTGGLVRGASSGVMSLLGMGTASQTLQVNSAGTDISWSSGLNPTVQFVGSGPIAFGTGDHVHLVPVWKDTTGVITHCVVVVVLSTSTVAVVEYRRVGNDWVHDGTLGRDAVVTLSVTASLTSEITFFAIDSPGTSTNRILFVATNDVGQSPDTYEVDSIDLADGEGLTATAVTIAGSNQPTDTDTMGTVSCAASTTSLLTIFEDDGHTAVISGNEAGFTFTYNAAKVSAIDTSIDVGGSNNASAYSMFLIGTQLLLLRLNTATRIAAFSLWEMDASFSLTTEFMDVDVGKGGPGLLPYASHLSAIQGSFALASVNAISTTTAGGWVVVTFPLDSLTGNS